MGSPSIIAAPAIRFIASRSALNSVNCVHLQCHVKPGASKQREGILSVSATAIELCVSARAREGEANKAVRELLSHVLNVPKSDVEVIRGLKSREKTVSVTGVQGNNELACLERVGQLLQSASR
ncbi:hypothetical protein PVAG01_03052 [Phlyctema vagabunda]|uniref:YggU-like protein n=1 Tax=Phlyctema vagabunda TaxID=108571 RepID=A0ABR4PTR6_9HELO